MKLIDLYVAEVGRHLPPKQRADIETELRSALEDAVEDEASTHGRPADEALAADVLKRYGSPEKTAASYLPPRYLIGPELFPTYVRLVGVVAGAVTLALVIAFGVQLGASAETRANVGVAAVQTLAQWWQAMFFSAAVVTLIFAIFEWTSRRTAPAAKAWDPSTLREHPKRDPGRVNPFELTFEIVFSIAALVVFNLYPQWVGFYFLRNGQWQMVALLTPAFFQYLPWLNLWCLLQIVVDFIVLAQRRRQPLTDWLEIGLELLRVAVFFQIVLGPAVIQIDAAALGRLGAGTLTAQQIQNANEGFNTGVRIGLGIACAIGAVDLVRDVYRRLESGQVRLATH